MKAKVVKLEALVKYYEEQLRLSKHRQFAASSEKSKYDSQQISLFDEAEATADASQPEPELVKIEKHYRKARRTNQERLPEDLAVEVEEHDLPEEERQCPECGGTLHEMSCQVHRTLKLIPAQAIIVEHIQHVYSCRNCEQENDHVPVVKAPISEPVIKGSFATPEAIAHVAWQKYGMGIPLYRQEQDWNRNGIMLSRQTLSNWLIRAAQDWLVPIYDRLRERLLARDILHADETTVQVLREAGKSPQSKSYMWLYRTSGDAEYPIVLYEYQPDRKKEHPAVFLHPFSGYLHTDGYDGYHNLPVGVVVVGCWAHLRRKFHEALKGLPRKDWEGSNALRGREYCDRLFDLERDFAQLKPQERFQKRMEVAKPVLDEFFTWAMGIKVIPLSGIGKAITYALSQRKYLEHYLLDGRLEISNNRAERSIKPFVIGRKAWLFANTPAGAKASAVFYSIVETAKENRLNPYAYLAFIFRNAPNWSIHDHPEAVDRLLPDSTDIPDHVRLPHATTTEDTVASSESETNSNQCNPTEEEKA